MNTNNENDSNALDVQPTAAPKRRARIVKKDTDHVYTASHDQGERFDTVSDERTHKRAAVAAAKDEKAAAIHALESEVLVPPKKNRGRPSKKYLEEQRAYEEALARRQAELDETRAALNSTSREVSSAVEAEDEDAAVTVPPVTLDTAGLMAVAEAALASAVETPVAKDAEPAPVAVENTNIEPSLFDVVDDATDDVPEFIRMQQEAAAAMGTAQPEEDNEEAEIVEPTADENPEEADAESAAESPKASETKAKGEQKNLTLLRQLSEAYAEGQRLIIVEDVPVVDNEGYAFVVDEEPEDEHIPFRRFCDDVLVKPQSSADASRSSNNGSTEQRTVAEAVKAAPAPEKPAAKRLGEITIEAEGVMEIDNQGVGYLRSSDYHYMPSPDDIFVSQNQIRSYSLKTGDLVSCVVRVPREGEKYYALKEVISINGCAPHQVRDHIAFEHLTPLFPDEQYKLAKRGVKSPLSCRIVDLFAPIGKGQRALIVAQPKTGKTILMKQIANAIAANNPEAYLIMLLIDERPEEVTDMARTVNAEVIASTFDEPAKRHVRIANIVLEKAKRMVECGKDVVIFLDSITRLARAFNTEAPTSGKILTGGVDANALQKPKRFFGAARNIEGGGSLTIIATALIDTGSKMDEVIFEEFKGTGNMELVLDRGLANKRIFPAVNLVQSSTRREDLLLDEITVNRMFITRNYMSDMSAVEAMNFLRKHLESTISNEEFIASVGSTK